MTKSTTLRLLICPLMSIATCGLGQAENKAFDLVRCQSLFLENEGTWIAKTFTDAIAFGTNEARTGNDAFTPIKKIIVSGGTIYAQTWGLDTVPASLALDSSQLLLKPRYLDYLAVDGEVDRAAKRVQPYALENVRNVLKIDEDCSSPEKIVLSIEKGDDLREVIGTITLLRDHRLD